MILKKLSVPLILSAILCMASSVWAEPQAKTYQVTGPIVEMTDTKIVVQKGSEKWEIARDGDTKITGELKVGAKVTIEYRMFATTVAVKADKPAEKAK